MATLQLTLAPAQSVVVPSDFGTVFVDVVYTRAIDPPATDELSDLPNTVQEIQRVALDASWKGNVTLSNAVSPSTLVARFLSPTGTVQLEKSVAAADASPLAISLSAEDVKAIATLPPLPPTQPTVTRKAFFLQVGASRFPFQNARLRVAPISVGNGNWKNLGLDRVFNVATPSTTSVQWWGDAWSPSGASWIEVPLTVDGRFEVELAAGGDAWLWWLTGEQSAIGVVLDALVVPEAARPERAVTVAIPLPPMGVTTDGDGRVPVGETEGEVATNPDVYTEDPGEFCKPFKNPERVLGERSFFVTLRVEQPVISSEASVKAQPLPILTFDTTRAAVAEPAAPTGATPTLMGRVVDAVRATVGSFTASGPTATFVRQAIPAPYVDMLQRLERGRMHLDAAHPVQWEGDISRYQAATVARGHILEYRMRWRSNGYSLGTVAKTLTLAPRQTRRIQKIDWQRSERARRDERTQLADQVSDSLTADRNYDDAVRAHLSEWSQGESNASTASAAGGFGFATVGFVIGGGGGGSTAHSDSSQSGGRDTAAAEEQNIRDTIHRYGDALRRLESTVVAEVTETESVTGTTEIIRNQNYAHALTVVYYQILRHLRVDTDLAGVRECLFVPFAITPFTVARAYRWRDFIRRGLRDPAQASALKYLHDVLTNFAGSNVPPGRRSDQPVRYVFGSIYIRVAIERPKDKDDGSYDAVSWLVLSRFLGAPPVAIYARLKAKLEAERDAVFQKEHAPTIAASWVDTLELWAGSIKLDADFTLATSYAYNGVVRVDFTAPVSQSVTRETLAALRVIATKDLTPGSVANLRNASFTYETDQVQRAVRIDQGEHDLVTVETGAHDPAGGTLFAPPDEWERRNIRQEMINAATSLVEHLNENVEYYHKVIWWSLDRDRIFMLIDGVYVPGTNGVSVASIVEREPIAIVGNSLVFRVSAGAFVGLGNIKTPAQLYDYYAANKPKRDPMLVALPTDGLYAQTLMDECGGLEEHFGNIDWALNDPDPELGTIAPELLTTRQTSGPSTTPTQLPQTIINLQNAPQEPAPTGLAGALAAVQNANAFRDMTGLAGTQANAAAALQTAAALATSFGNQAAALKLADMASKSQATQTADQRLATVQNAVNKNLVSPADAQSHANSILGELHAPPSSGPLQENTIADAIRQTAGRPGSTIEASSPHGQVKLSLASFTQPAGTQTTTPAAQQILALAAAAARVDGIDVHYPNTLPTWANFTAAGFEFMLFRTSEQQKAGALVADSVAHVTGKGYPAANAFPNRWKDAGDNHVIRGAYHYYRYTGTGAGAHDGTDQANTVVDMVGRLVPGALAPTLDFENDNIVTGVTAPATADLRADVELFLDRIETRLGRTPWVYTSFSAWGTTGYNGHFGQGGAGDPAFAHFADYPLWLVVYRNYSAPNTAYNGRATLDPTNTPPPAGKTYPTNIVPSPWGQDWDIAQYTAHAPTTLQTQYGFDNDTDFDITRQGIYALRGLADLGHTAPHVAGNTLYLAFTEPDGAIHLRKFDGAWQDDRPTQPLALASGDISAVVRGDDQVLVYRGRYDGHVYALSRKISNPGAWSLTDLSDATKGTNAQAIASFDDPLVAVVSGQVGAVHWDENDHQRLLLDTSGTWHGNDFSGGTSMPTIAGSAVLYDDGGVCHVATRAGTDGHLVDYFRDSATAKAVDLTAGSVDTNGHPPPAATYRPSAYSLGTGEPCIVFRALRGDVWQITRHALVATNLSSAATAPKCAGSPSAVMGNEAHILYRTKDGRIIDLFESGTTFNFQEVPCSVRAAADPTAYYDGTTIGVTFRTVDGTVHRATLTNGSWTCEDTAPPAASGPAPMFA